MVMSLKKHAATEKRGFDYCLATFPRTKQDVVQTLRNIQKFYSLDRNAAILEIGAAQGKLVAACQLLGYQSHGIEPNENAINVSKQLSHNLGIHLDIIRGYAEEIPYDSNRFDLVIGESVLEHVRDFPKVLAEISRVLKPKGALYFTTASVMCPRQDEIRFFPFFSWYPQKLKVRVMNWTLKNKPSLVGYTETPAINWFSPWGTRKALKEIGFNRVYDRWDLIQPESYSVFKKFVLRIIKLNDFTGLIGDILLPGCGYLAIRD